MKFNRFSVVAASEEERDASKLETVLVARRHWGKLSVNLWKIFYVWRERVNEDTRMKRDNCVKHWFDVVC